MIVNTIYGEMDDSLLERRRRRYYVEIDGQRFFVDSADEAAALLRQAEALATQAAQSAASEAVVKARTGGTARLVGLRPRIETNAPQTPAVRESISVIRAIYADARREAERELRAQLKAIDQDERDIEDLIAIGEL